MLDRVTLRKEPGLREKACGGLRFYGSGVPHVSGLRVRVLTFLHSNPASDLVEDRTRFIQAPRGFHEPPVTLSTRRCL